MLIMMTKRFCNALVLGAALSSVPASAHDYTVGDLFIEHPESRATPAGVSVGVGYMKIVNRGSEADRLEAASTPVAGRVEIHESVDEDGMMTMVEQEQGIKIPAGGSIELAPRGYHLMIMGLNQPLEEGDTIPVTLRFERAGAVDVELEVRALGAR